jgi:hypothetical protein
LAAGGYSSKQFAFYQFIMPGDACIFIPGSWGTGFIFIGLAVHVDLGMSAGFIGDRKN